MAFPKLIISLLKSVLSDSCLLQKFTSMWKHGDLNHRDYSRDTVSPCSLRFCTFPKCPGSPCVLALSPPTPRPMGPRWTPTLPRLIQSALLSLKDTSQGRRMLTGSRAEGHSQLQSGHHSRPKIRRCKNHEPYRERRWTDGSLTHTGWQHRAGP